MRNSHLHPGRVCGRKVFLSFTCKTLCSACVHIWFHAGTVREFTTTHGSGSQCLASGVPTVTATIPIQSILPPLTPPLSTFPVRTIVLSDAAMGAFT